MFEGEAFGKVFLVISAKFFNKQAPSLKGLSKVVQTIFSVV